jgi:hypothetical protein
VERDVSFGLGIGEDLHFVAQIEQPGDLAQDERLRNHRERVQKEGDAERPIRRRSATRLGPISEGAAP